MAEFIEVGAKIFPSTPSARDDGFGAFGNPVPFFRRQAAFEHAKSMGLDTAKSYDVVGKVSDAVARDEPYRAMEEAMKFLDLTGSYRLLAVVCTAASPSTQPE